MMIDRKYFEEVLPDQLRIMEKPVRLTIHLASGAEYMVHALVAHDQYVVLKVYGKGTAPEHTRRWQDQHPADDAEILDQVCIPYHIMALTHLTARSTRGDDSRRLMGFGPT